MRGTGHKPYIREIPREEIIKLVDDMNRVGFGVVPGYLEPRPWKSFSNLSRLRWRPQAANMSFSPARRRLRERR